MSPLTLLRLVTALSPCVVQEGRSTAGYARTAFRVERGEMPRSTEVVVADLIDYHHHSLPLPKAGEVVALDVRAASADVDADGEALVQFGIATARAHEAAELPPLALALAVDCSGSMADSGKMEMVHAGLRRLAERLRPDDRLAIVAWSDEARLVLPLARVGDGCALRRAIERLRPTGSTNLDAGLTCAFESLNDAELPPGTSRRVLLLTDGIANVGVTDPEQILSRSSRFRERGVDLATIGVGADLNDDLLRRLAHGGRGLYHFVSDQRDLEKVFVDDLQSLLVPVARRVRLDVTLPAGLRVAKVFGHPFEETRRGFRVALDDLNGGMTQVVIARLDVAACSKGCVVVDARLTFDEAGSGERCVAADGTTLRIGESRRDRDDERTEALALDPEVRKNVTIALLADALHQAALADEAGEPRRAGRLLDAALGRVVGPDRDCGRGAREEDADVARVAALVRGARAAVARRCDSGERSHGMDGRDAR